jgi:glutathione synthase/RimK-type ligase-like ATP-grasp enzyme
MNWIKVEACSDLAQGNKHYVCVHPDLVPGIQSENELFIKVGSKQICAGIQVDPNRETEVIQLSNSLIDELCIPLTQQYQMKINHNHMQLGPIIGLMLGEQRYCYHHSFMQEYTDAMVLSLDLGGLVIAFKSCSIDWENEYIYGLYFDHSSKEWEYSKLPIPETIFRRGFTTNDPAAKKLQAFTGNRLFNSMKLNKWQIYDKLSHYPDFTKYLPKTAILTRDSLAEFIHHYNRVIIKPTDLSRGRGIITLEKQEEHLILQEHIDDDIPLKSQVTIENVKLYLSNKGFFNGKHIIQNYLNLSKINGSPWDIRIIMQKDENLQWQCNGIECRLADSNHYITNISRGGRALKLDQSVNLAFGSQISASVIEQKLISISSEFCTIMDLSEGHYAEFGLDFAVDADQQYWFIEANVRPTFNGFKQLNYQEYLRLCSAPIVYAAALTGYKRRIVNE